MNRKLSICAFFLLCATALMAQGKEGVQMADTLRSNGKIYVVVAVALTIFAGLVLYLVRLDRKISRLEKQTFLNSK